MLKKKDNSPKIEQKIVDKLVEIIDDSDLEKAGGGYWDSWGGGSSWGGGGFAMTCGDYNTTSWY